MMKLLWLCCGVLLSTTIHGAIYKRVEADGSVTYTDTPGHNTQAVDVNTLTTNTTNVIPSSKITPNTTSQRSTPSPKKTVNNYQITFLTPAHLQQRIVKSSGSRVTTTRRSVRVVDRWQSTSQTDNTRFCIG